MNLPLLLGLIPCAYIVGSIPFGLLVGFTRGIDVRKAGSGNIGATNVGRLLGWKYFALVFTLDLLKGLLPMLAAGMLLRRGGTPASAMNYLLWLAVGFAGICGHLFSCFLKFKGGKGVATSTGVVLGIFPYFTLPCIAVIAAWLAIFFLTRYVSLASMLSAALLPVAYVGLGLMLGWPLETQWPLLVFAVVVAAMIIYKHRSNIARLRVGTELKFKKKPVAAASADAP